MLSSHREKLIKKKAGWGRGHLIKHSHLHAPRTWDPPGPTRRVKVSQTVEQHCRFLSLLPSQMFSVLSDQIINKKNRCFTVNTEVGTYREFPGFLKMDAKWSHSGAGPDKAERGGERRVKQEAGTVQSVLRPSRGLCRGRWRKESVGAWCTADLHTCVNDCKTL